MARKTEQWSQWLNCHKDKDDRSLTRINTTAQMSGLLLDWYSINIESHGEEVEGIELYRCGGKYHAGRFCLSRPVWQMIFDFLILSSLRLRQLGRTSTFSLSSHTGFKTLFPLSTRHIASHCIYTTHRLRIFIFMLLKAYLYPLFFFFFFFYNALFLYCFFILLCHTMQCIFLLIPSGKPMQISLMLELGTLWKYPSRCS